MFAPLAITVEAETWLLASSFVISRGAKSEAVVVVATVTNGRATGRGECVPYARYGETVAGVEAAVRQAAGALMVHPGPPSALRHKLQTLLPAGAARNALDCALWDFEAKLEGTTVARLTGLARRSPLLTAYTLSLDSPGGMAAKAASVRHLPLLKLKLGGPGDEARLRAVRKARPDARLIADANEAWTPDMVAPLLAVCRETEVELVEQPLPSGNDAALENRPPYRQSQRTGPLSSEGYRRVAICADESLHTRADLPRLAHRYDAINIKLDKAGGLTEALALAQDARALGLKVMIGCMVATSLAMAPALLIAANADWVDLDGPLLLARDRAEGLAIRDGIIAPALPTLWG